MATRRRNVNRVTRQIRAWISLFAHTENVTPANARVFECNQVVRARSTLGKYDPRLVCATGLQFAQRRAGVIFFQ